MSIVTAYEDNLPTQSKYNLSIITGVYSKPLSLKILGQVFKDSNIDVNKV